MEKDELLENEKAKSNLSIEGDLKPNVIKIITLHHMKTVILQYSVVLLMIIAGIILNLTLKDNVSLTIGSLSQAGTEASNINVNVSTLLILGGIYSLIKISSDIKISKK